MRLDGSAFRVRSPYDVGARIKPKRKAIMQTNLSIETGDLLDVTESPRVAKKVVHAQIPEISKRLLSDMRHKPFSIVFDINAIRCDLSKVDRVVSQQKFADSEEHLHAKTKDRDAAHDHTSTPPGLDFGIELFPEGAYLFSHNRIVNSAATREKRSLLHQKPPLRL